MKPQLRVAFAYFWPGFTADHFRAFFPFVYDKYDLVPSQIRELCSIPCSRRSSLLCRPAPSRAGRAHQAGVFAGLPHRREF
jgi:hypothetical protein